jgi:23S rRNA (cytidine1920-2'-O)/16S rRNA (cytidine1409-2'-O)-methyltransferase
MGRVSEKTKSHKMRLDDLLVSRGLAATRALAERLIRAGDVRSGDRVLDKPGLQVVEDAALHVAPPAKYVSRGGLKLEAALDAFDIAPFGWICADIGASTGGFTDCLLQRGAARVYAIDVGYGQLAWSLRRDARVVSIERANIRHLAALPQPVSLATVDVSFIGLGMVLPRVAALLVPGGQAVCLIKPQFEVEKGQVGKGGVVRDPALHRAAITKVIASAQAAGLAAGGLISSPITGPAGNVEFLVWLRLGAGAPAAEQVAAWIDACIKDV